MTSIPALVSRTVLPPLLAMLALAASWGLGPSNSLAETPTKSAEGSDAANLPPRHRDFLELAGPLLQKTEREVFFALQQNYRLDAFIRKFWRMRDPFPETPRNELRDRLQQNFETLRREIDDASPDEATLLLLHGEPDRRFRDACDLLQPINVWYYRSSPLVPAEFFAVFRRSHKQWVLWNPTEGIDVLLARSTPQSSEQSLQRIQQECSRGDEISTALTLSIDWEHVHQRALGSPDPEWALALLESSAQLAAGEDPRNIQAHSRFVGRRQSRAIVQTSLSLQSSGLQIGNSQGSAPDHNHQTSGPSATLRLILDGEVVRDEELFDSFRYRFDLPLADKDRNEDSAIPDLVIERYLRPGTYRLVLQVREPASESSWQLDEPLIVPPLSSIQEPTGKLVTAKIDAPELLAPTRADSPESNGGSQIAASLRLSVPNRDLLVGRFRAEAITAGQRIRKVAFELDGQRVLSKSRPPYSVELNAGRVPRTHQLVAIAFDQNAKEIARDEVTVNAGPRRFAIRLLEPRRGGKYETTVRAVAEVDVPPLETLQSVEFFLNDQRVATLYQPPFALPIVIRPDQPLAFVRVVGTLGNGQQAEDLVFVNSPNEVEYFDVNLVEVYTSVTNRRGLPIEGLSQDQFQVFEDGRPQQIAEFRQVKDLPINACVLFDTSTSMIERLEEAKGAALHFFEQVLEARDRACLMTFNDVHELVVDFTHSPEVLAGGLKGVTAEGETALYDSLIHTLYLFNGVRGKRAIILLSDGADSKSTYRFSEVLEFARRTEVTIHVIGVDIKNRDMEVRARLAQLAKETGGRTFFIEEISELRRVYDLIERDLRSQYLLAYQSDGVGGRDEFREVRVKMAAKGMRARALSGYYP